MVRLDNVDAQLNAFVADERWRRPGNELAHLVLALAAERAVEDFWRRRLFLCSDRKRALIACRRFGSFDLGGQNVPVVIAERLGDQLQSFSVCGFDSLAFQGIAQRACASRKSRMRAPLHRRTEKIGACLADPLANGEGAEKIDTFTIPDGGRRRVYRPCR